VPCFGQGTQDSNSARESKTEVSLVNERPDAVVNIASELSLRVKQTVSGEHATKCSPLFYSIIELKNANFEISHCYIQTLQAII